MSLWRFECKENNAVYVKRIMPELSGATMPCTSSIAYICQ